MKVMDVYDIVLWIRLLILFVDAWFYTIKSVCFSNAPCGQ